jgi:hypothetical protein
VKIEFGHDQSSVSGALLAQSARIRGYFWHAGQPCAALLPQSTGC